MGANIVCWRSSIGDGERAIVSVHREVHWHHNNYDSQSDNTGFSRIFALSVLNPPPSVRGEGEVLNGA